MCLCACVTAAGSVGKRTGTIITRKKNNNNNVWHGPNSFDWQSTNKMCLVSPWKRQGLEVWAFDATHRTRTGSQKRERRSRRRKRVESPSKGDVIKSHRLDGDGRRLEELTRREEKQKINIGNEGHACGSLVSVKRTPPSLFSLLLSLNSWLFCCCCCCFSRSANFFSRENETKKWRVSCLKNKIKQNVKIPLSPSLGLGDVVQVRETFIRRTQEGNKVGCHWEVENYQERNFGAVGTLVRPLTVLNWINILI